jgi:hypothetical protein
MASYLRRKFPSQLPKSETGSQTAELLNNKTGGEYSYHSAWKDNLIEAYETEVLKCIPSDISAGMGAVLNVKHRG